MTTTPTPPNHPWQAYQAIEAWGYFLSSYWHYVEREMRRAAAEGAPIDALYQKQDGSWARASHLPLDHEFHEVLEKIKRGQAHVAFKPTGGM